MPVTTNVAGIWQLSKGALVPHDIIDNRHEKLIDHIQRILPGSQAAKFAVGYFFLSGL